MDKIKHRSPIYQLIHMDTAWTCLKNVHLDIDISASHDLIVQVKLLVRILLLV